MKTYTLIGGVNGVGKSSLLGVLFSIKNDLGIICDESSNTVIKCFEPGVNFMQETTLSGVRTLKTIQRAREKGYYIGVSSCNESLQRIANRVKKGGHDIPSEDVKRRFEKRFDDLDRVLPFCNEVKLFDNENGFTEVAEYKNGELIIKCERLPQWLSDFRQHFDSKEALK